MNRRRFALYCTLALCIIVTLVGVTLNAGHRVSPSADAAAGTAELKREQAAHPDRFTFDAHRTSRGVVVFSGEYLVWNAVDDRYQPGAPLVAIDIADSSVWSSVGVFPTDSSGRYSGTERIGGAHQVRARGTDASNRSLATSAPLMLTYDRPSTVVWTRVTAAKVEGGGVEVKGSVYSAWARDPQSNNIDYLGHVWQKLVIEQKVDGAWVRAGGAYADKDGKFSKTIADARGTDFRVFVAGAKDHNRVSRPFALPAD